jgi:hypothetical protein
MAGILLHSDHGRFGFALFHGQAAAVLLSGAAGFTHRACNLSTEPPNDQHR